MAVGGFVSLLGWALDVRRLTDWADTGTSIQPNGAVAALVAGTALIFLAFRWRAAALVAASSVAVLALATLAQHATGVSFGIDSLLLFDRQWGSVNTVVPGRMGVPASLSWMLAGIAIVLAQFRPALRLVPVLGLVLMLVGGLALTGYLFGATVLYTLPRLTAVSLQTATFIVGTGLALIASVPSVDPMRTLLSDSSAGVMARRTLPFVVALPLILGFLAVMAERQGTYDMPTGTAALVLTLIGLLCAVLWRGARAVQDRDTALTAVRQARLRADAALLETERKTVALLESIDDGFASFDAGWRFTYVNAAAERAIGQSRDEVLGKVLWELFPEITASAFAASLRRVADTESMVEFEGYNTIVGRWFSYRAYPTPDGGVAVYFRDLTESKRAEDVVARARSELLVTTDNAPVMLAHCDAEGRYLFVNQPYAVRFSRRREEIVGRTLAEVVGETSYRRFAPHVQTVLTGQDVHFEMAIPRGSEGPEVLHVAFTPERDTSGSVVGFVAALFEITARKRAEDALRDADRRKDEFLATLSHELRNPLAPITNCIEILRRAPLQGGQGAAAADRTLATLERQVRHMVRLVDDLLDVGRITRNTLTLRKAPVDLAGVVSQGLEAFEPQAAQAGQPLLVELEPGQPMIVDGDRARLVQIVGNLLSNAGRYSDAGRPIRLTLRQDAEFAVITVADEGIGIAPDKLQQIFQPFTQLHPALERSQGGLGIGLSLSRRLAELHGGRLEAYSAGEGEGSQFVVRLPLWSGDRAGASGG